MIEIIPIDEMRNEFGDIIYPERVALVQAAYVLLQELADYERMIIFYRFCRSCGEHKCDVFRCNRCNDE